MPQLRISSVGSCRLAARSVLPAALLLTAALNTTARPAQADGCQVTPLSSNPTSQRDALSKRILEISKAVDADPANLTLRADLAASQMKAKDYAAAITQYNAILTAKPDTATSLYNRGIAYSLQKDLSKAAADFAAYTRLKPTDAAGWNNLGIFLGQQKDYKGSIAAFTKYISLKPTDPNFFEVYKNRGIAYFNVQDWENAQADLSRYNMAKRDKDVPDLLAPVIVPIDEVPALLAVVKQAPGSIDPNAWFNLGIAYLGRKDNDNAVMAFTKSNALKTDPESLFNRALAYYNIGEGRDPVAFAKAEADCAAALLLKQDYADAVLVKADSEYGEKRWDAAAADYAKYAGMPGVSAENKLYAQKRRLQAELNGKSFAGVIAATDALIALNPAEAHNYFIRGTAKLAMKNFDSAIPDLVKYTGMKADDPMGFYNLGLAYSGKMDNVNAAASYEKASTVKPDLYDAANQAGSAYKKLADGDQADAAKCTAEYDKSVMLYDRTAGITTATPKQQADALYNEAAALEAKAHALHSTEAQKAADAVLLRLESMSPK